MAQPISSSGDIPPHPLFDNPTLVHIFEKIFYYCSERDLKRLTEVNRTLKAVVLGDKDSVRKMILAALIRIGFHLPEIPLCLRTQLFPPHPTSPRTRKLQESLLMITREAVTKNAISSSFPNTSKSYRIRQIIDAQLLAGDHEGAAATIQKMGPCLAPFEYLHIFHEYYLSLQNSVPSSWQLLYPCQCTAYARLARAQFLSKDFQNSEATIRQITSSKFVSIILLAELAAEMTKEPSQKEKATALFQEAREKFPDHRNRFLRLRILLYIAQLEVASGLSSEESLTSAENISKEELLFSEKLSALIHIALTKHKLTKKTIPLSLYDSLKELTFPDIFDFDATAGLNASIGLLPLIAPHTEDPEVALQKEKEVFTHLLNCTSQSEGEGEKTQGIDWAKYNTPDKLCKLANLRRLACTEAPATVVQVIQGFDDPDLSSATYIALLSAIQHDRVELMQLLLTTFSELFQKIDDPLRKLALRFFPALFRNNPIPILPAKEILDSMQARTPENRRSNYNRVVIAVKNGHPLLAAALLRDMRCDYSSLYSCLDPSFDESMKWLPLGSTEQ